MSRRVEKIESRDETKPCKNSEILEMLNSCLGAVKYLEKIYIHISNNSKMRELELYRNYESEKCELSQVRDKKFSYRTQACRIEYRFYAIEYYYNIFKGIQIPNNSKPI